MPETKTSRIFVVIGFLFVFFASCGAAEKASKEGWNGPSSKPGAAQRR